MIPVGDVPVLILAGGFGTRLRPAYDGGPKAMAPVAGKPFLFYLLQRLQTAGIRRVVLCLGHRAEEVRSAIHDGPGLEIEYSIETAPLGTGGALALAASRLPAEERFFAMNGDSVCAVDLAAMLRAHVERGATASIALAAVADAGRYGAVEVDPAGHIVAFHEKAAGGTALVNGGVYLLEPRALTGVPAGRSVSLEREVLPLLAGHGLLAFPTGGYFIDIGLPEDFARAQVEFPERFGDSAPTAVTS